MLLKISNLSKKFGDSIAVDDVSIKVQENQFIGIIGASGAGKSTLLRMLNRLTDPTDGDIIYKGRNISN
ncbi:MAG: ATP-binding cassette domain-containing protein, partial [Paracoccaceae bacterium]